MEKEGEDDVRVKRADLEELLGAFRNVRTVALICAPQFGAGSHGEAIVAQANGATGLVARLEKLLATVAVAAVAALGASGAVPVRWTVETSRFAPAAFDAVAGETLALEASFKSYGRDVSTSNQTAFLCWQTNGMMSAWWVTNATASGCSARALFTPEMTPDATVVNGFIGLSETNAAAAGALPSLSYRAAFTLRFRRGPGAVPNALETPPRILDLAHTTVVNPPWPTAADYAATTSVMRTELKAYVDEQIEAGGSRVPSKLALSQITNSLGVAIAEDSIGPYAQYGGVEYAMYSKIADEAVVAYAPEYNSIDNWKSALGIPLIPEGLVTTNDIVGLVKTNDNGTVVANHFALGPNGEIDFTSTAEIGMPPSRQYTLDLRGFVSGVRMHSEGMGSSGFVDLEVYRREETGNEHIPKVKIGDSSYGGILLVGGTNVTDAIAAVGPQVKSEVLDEVEANYTRKGYSWVRPDDWTLDYSMSNTTASAVRAFAETDDSYRVISNVETVVSSAHEGNVFMRFLDPNTEKKSDVDAYFAVDAGITVNTNTGAFATAQDGLFRVGATRGGELRYVDVASQIMTKPSTNTVSWYANDVAGSERKAVNDAALEILTNAPLIGSNTYVEISGSVTNVYPYAIYRTFKPLMTRTGAGNIAAFAVSQHVLASAAHYADGHRSYSPQQFDDGAGNVATLVKLAWVNLADWARQNGHTEAEIAAAEIEDIALIRCSKATAVPDACIPYFMNELAAQRIFGASMRGVCGWTHCQELTNAVPVVMEDLRTMRFSPWYYDKYHDPVTGMEGFSRAEVCARLAEMGLQYRIHSGDSGKPVWVSVDNRPIILTTWAYGRVKSAYGASYVKGYYIIKHFVEDYGDTLKGIEQ